ncbi:MAG: hypothetical protein KAT65_17485, partial [Methanophagales archaeon]|nr:hypothetical protein [Methanophagales archaeon]
AVLIYAITTIKVLVGGSPSWAGLRSLGSERGSLVGVAAVRIALGVAMSAAASLFRILKMK